MKKAKKIYHQKLQLRKSTIDRLKESLQTQDVKGTALQLLADCINENSSLKQTGLLKKVGSFLHDQASELRDDVNGISLCLQVMGEIFVACEAKNPARRALASVFDGLDASVSEIAGQKLSSAVVSKIEEAQEKLDHVNDESELPIATRAVIDVVSSLMENFHLGEEIVKRNGINVLQFLAYCLQYFVDVASSATAPAIQSTRMIDCLVTTKTIIATLQNCKQIMQITDKDVCNTPCKLASEWTKPIKSIYTELFSILNNDFIPDCQNASGMAVCLIISLVTVSDDFPSAMLKIIFPRNFADSTEVQDIPEWLLINLVKTTDEGSVAFKHLCLCHGVLTMVPLQDLITKIAVEKEQVTLLFDVLFPDLCRLCESLTEPSSCLQAFRVLTLWTEQARNVFRNAAAISPVPPYVRAALLGSSSIPQTLLEYVWNYWDHPTEGVRHQTKAIFENVVRTHVMVLEQDPQEDAFLKTLTGKLISVGWHTRGKYGPLCCLTSVLGARCILKWYPDVPAHVFAVLKDINIAPHAMDFIDIISKTHKEEIISFGDDLDEWFKMWISPVLVNLHDDDNNHRFILTQHCLPKLLKCCPESLHFMVTTLQANGGDNTTNIKALITCLKTARSLGLIKVNQTVWSEEGVSSNTWGGVVPVKWIQKALCHADEQCRLDALGLLCDSPRTTETVSMTDVELLKMFLPLNMNSQSPSFRQQCATHLKKLLLRIKECIRLSVKTIEKLPEESEATDDSSRLAFYKDFIWWYSELLFTSLFPGASFARRTTALHSLSLMNSIFGDSRKDGNASKMYPFHFHDVMTEDNIQVLLDCFNDTYGVNKLLAYELLTSCPHHLLPFQELQSLTPWLLLVERLITSPRAVDASTASALLKLLVDRCTVPLYIEKTGLCAESTRSANYGNEVSLNHLEAENLPTQARCDVIYLQAFRVLSYLLATLTSHGLVAKESLHQAAGHAPMHGVIYCLRMVLTHLDLRTVSGDDAWKQLISSLLIELFCVSDLVSPVVTSSSPEGHIVDDDCTDEPTDAMPDEGLIFAPSSQILLVCCWRTMKEVALLLGDLVHTAPIAITGMDSGGLLTLEQVKKIGHFFTTVLLTSKHRGAFELAYTGFVKLCDMLWRCPAAELRCFPLMWLDSLMSDISAAVPSEVLSGTRRSAGIPFFIQAIVTTEPFAAGKDCFKRVMKDLIHMASQPVDKLKPQDSSLPQVHACNILRALHRDTRLGENVFPFVADGLMVAISGFLSDSWAVRNSSTLLFSALMTRVFGVKKSKDENSRRNCMTGREFFTRFPSLHGFLLEELRQATATIERSASVTLHPSLYPVLVLLSRLYPSSMDGVDSTLNMAPFIPYVIRCGGSSVMKTRLMSARAIVPLVTGKSLVPVLKQLLTSLPCSIDVGVRQNVVHGLLLQVQYLIREHLMDSFPAENLKGLITSDVMPLIEQLAWIGTKNNPCSLTRAVFLEIALMFVGDCHWLKSPDGAFVALSQTAKRSFLRMHEYVKNIAMDEINPLRMPGLVAIGDVFLREISATICLKIVDEKENISLRELLAKQGQEDDDRQPSRTQEKPNEALEYRSTLLGSPRSDLSEQDCYTYSCAEDCSSDSQMTYYQVIQSLLSSPHYEVRSIVLGHLSLKIQESRTRMKPLSTRGYGCTSKAEECSQDEWQYVATQLIEMMMGKENHLDCLSQVYEVLSVLSGFVEFPLTLASGETVTLTQCWQHALHQGAKGEQRGSVRCAVLEFLACLLPRIYRALESQCDHEACATAEVTSYLDLLRSTSAISESVDVRYKTAELLSNSAQLLLDPLKKLGGTPLEFWSIVISLLHDDDPSVRDSMATVMSLLRQSDGLGKEDYPVIPPLAVKLVFQEIWSMFFTRVPNACLQWLMGWLSANHASQTSDALHDGYKMSDSIQSSDIDLLFEKGSLNTYEENVVTANAAWECLKSNKDDLVNNLNLSESLLKQHTDRYLLEIEENSITGSAESFNKVYHTILGVVAFGLVPHTVKLKHSDTVKSTGDKGDKNNMDAGTCCKALSWLQITDNAEVQELVKRVHLLYSRLQCDSKLNHMISHPVMRICIRDLCDMYGYPADCSYGSNK